MASEFLSWTTNTIRGSRRVSPRSGRADHEAGAPEGRQAGSAADRSDRARAGRGDADGTLGGAGAPPGFPAAGAGARSAGVSFVPGRSGLAARADAGLRRRASVPRGHRGPGAVLDP